MAVVIGNSPVEGDVLTLEDNVVIRFPYYNSGTGKDLDIQSVILDDTGYSIQGGGSANQNWYPAVRSVYRFIGTSIAIIYRGSLGYAEFFPVRSDLGLKLADYSGITGSTYEAIPDYTTYDIYNESALFVEGAVVFEFDIDFTQGSGVLSFVFKERSTSSSSSTVTITGSTTITDEQGLDQAILTESSIPNDYIFYRMGSKLYIKPSPSALTQLDTVSTPFLVNGKLKILDNLVPFGRDNRLKGSAFKAYSSFSIIPPISHEESVLITMTDPDDISSFSTVAIPAIERADLGTSAADITSASPNFTSIGSNTSEGLLVNLDKPYLLQVESSSMVIDYQFKSGLIFLGSVGGSALKPEGGVEAQDSESEVVYYIPTDSNIGFAVYNEVEGVGETEAVKQYLGSEADVIAALEADGFTLDKTNAPVIGIIPPTGNEIVVYEEVGVILQNYYFTPSTVYLDQLTQGDEVFWYPTDTGSTEYGIRVSETFNVPQQERWTETFSVTATEFDQVAITALMVTELQGSSNLSGYTITDYDHYLGIKY